MTADLLAALEAIRRVGWGDPAGHGPHIEAEIEAAIKQARAAIAAHKAAHRGGADDACPCYGEGWQAGHEAERKH